MKAVIYIAPFVKKRYKGGITRIAEYLSSSESIILFERNGLKLHFFNSIIFEQSKNTEGNFSFNNIRQAILFLYSLIKRVLKRDFEAIHMNSSSGLPLLKDQIIILLCSIFTSKKIFFQIHYSGIDETFLKNPVLRSLQFALLKRMHRILLLSENFKNQLISIGFSETKLIVLHNFHVVKYKNVVLESNPNKPLRLIFLGSISRRKGVLDIIEALKKTEIDYTLNVLGDFASHEMEVECKEQIMINKLTINFLGYLEGKLKEYYLSNSDILLLPSYAEGFPMVIPEAMAYGCAIISTNIAGTPEIVKDRYNGFLIEPGQVVELKNKIEYLDKNRDILFMYRKNSLSLSNSYSIENYIDKYSFILKSN